MQPVLGKGSKLLLEKSKAGDLQQFLELSEQVEAPVAPGQSLGAITLRSGGETVARIPLVAEKEVPKISFGGLFLRLLSRGIPSF